MALNYLDSSALVKRYLPEVGSSWVAQLCEAEPTAISLLTVAELASSLARRTRESALTEAQRDTLFRLFVADARSYLMVEVNQTVTQQAASLLLSSPMRLRSLDALHLASARWLLARARRRGIATGSFIAADHRLIEAAEWAGLRTANPEDHP